MDDFDICEIEGVSSTFERTGINKYCPHIPTKKQRAFLECEDLEAMYGGAAGGGKSDALLMGALQDVDQRDSSGLILRRHYRDLNHPEALLTRAHEWFRGTDAVWSEKHMRYKFPSGAVITFGYFDNENHKDQYAGAKFTYIAWDELTQFPESWYTWMFSRLRRDRGSNIRTRVRSATNPGNIGHVWVKRRFVDLATAKGRFFPALLGDNPYIDQVAYRESLSKLDTVTRNQLEKGLWTQDVSALVYRYDASKNSIITAPDCKHKVLGIDYGLQNDDCAWTIFGWRPKDPIVYILQSWKKSHIVPGVASTMTKEINETHKFEGIVGDATGLGIAYAQQARWDGVPVELAAKQNKRGYIGLFNGELEQSRIKVVESGCSQLIEEWEQLAWADETRTKEDDAFANHCADATLYGWRRARAFLATMSTPGTQAIHTAFAKW